MSFEQIGNRKSFAPLPGGGYAFTLEDEAVRLEYRHVRRKDHDLHAEVDVQCDWAGVRKDHEGSVSCCTLNLSSQPARIARAKYVAERVKSKPENFDWPGIFDEACRRVIQAERNGTDAIVLDDAPAIGPPRDFLVYGLPIPADSHSQLVADGDGLKSLLTLLVLGEMAKQGIPVLYLDWEWNAERHKARKLRLFGSARLETLFYLRCRNGVTLERDRIRRLCDERQVQFMGLDSIGAACDGKLADDDVARAYNRALDDLPPSLAAAHVPKGSTDPRVDLKAFGSAFFHNYARMTWSVRKQPLTDDVCTVLLTPHKQNDGPRVRPVALEFSFHDQITVRNVDPAGIEGLADSLPVWQRMKHALAQGPLTLARLAEDLGADVDTVDRNVRRKKDLFTRVQGPDGVSRVALLERRVA